MPLPLHSANRPLLALAAAALSMGAADRASAHSFWVEPASFRPDAGNVLRIELRNGERFRGETVLRDESIIESFLLAGPDGSTPVVGRSGGRSSYARPGSPGTYVIAYRSAPIPHELPPDEFRAYLQEEGLAAVLAQRARLGESDDPGREVYSRCAKSIVCVGESTGPGHDRVLGLSLELVPLVHPNEVAPGDALPVRLLFHGMPLAGATVIGACRDDSAALERRVTDSEGRAVFHRASAGPWMGTAIHMVRAPPGVDADWESFWASLTLEVDDRPRR